MSDDQWDEKSMSRMSDFSDPLGSSESDDEDDGWASSEFDMDTTARPGGASREEVDDLQEIKDMSREETVSINRWRQIVVSLLVVTGALLSTFTFVTLRGVDNANSIDAYELFATTIEDITTSRVRQIHRVATGFAKTVTSLASAGNDIFPNITVPNFEQLASQVRDDSGLESMAFAPIILESQRKQWEAYAWENQGWIADSRRAAVSDAENDDSTSWKPGDNYMERNITSFIFDTDFDGKIFPAEALNGRYVPLWQMSPAPFDPKVIPSNSYGGNFAGPALEATEIIRGNVFTPIHADLSRQAGRIFSTEEHEKFHAQFSSLGPTKTSSLKRPHATMFSPVFNDTTKATDVKIIGFICSVMAFDMYLARLVPDGVDGIHAVLRNNCRSPTHSYELSGSRSVYLGPIDMHEGEFNSMERVSSFSIFKDEDLAAATPGHCQYSLHFYPSKKFMQSYKTNIPAVFAGVVAGVFFVMAAAFFFYDRSVSRRNNKVEVAAARSNALVSSLFPTNVRDQLYEQAEEEKKRLNKSKTEANMRMNRFLGTSVSGNENALVATGDLFGSKPIAELFPATTVMFGDISGFTAWSSSREPTQVFMLLETLYHAFDELAKKRGVFKVETIGDCYVAVTGLPMPRKDHAISMCRFARECLSKMVVLTKQLEVSLGPDTSDLNLRIGLHSGSVTAGVLRGERSRFQLFGDTMNTAARMESNGVAGRIHMSGETAALLKESGKGEWLEPRESTIVAKGKGEMQTFWVKGSISKKGTSACSFGRTEHDDTMEEEEFDENDTVVVDVADLSPCPSEKIARLVDWNADVLCQSLRHVVARRNAVRELNQDSSKPTTRDMLKQAPAARSTVLEEVKEIIELPSFDPGVADVQQDPESIFLDEKVTSEIREYIAEVAALYRENPFHNFEHAAHVTMSVKKMLSRIVAPHFALTAAKKSEASKMHDHTYGITSDPLVQFACVFSALIHDADHPGVPNGQLVKENSLLATLYKGKSVAEQNSVDLAFKLLAERRFRHFRVMLMGNTEEEARFRQLVVNSVMATDVMDSELKLLRNRKWEKAFSGAPLGTVKDESEQEAINRKATIVIEHLIQASDVSHTMQHWHIYRKWNERLFLEFYAAYEAGRAEKNPLDYWYKGEIGFFDYYIIPLARKLKDCGVFGVSSDEYLAYALRNRDEWERRGNEVTCELRRLAEMRSSSRSRSNSNSGGDWDSESDGESKSSYSGSESAAETDVSSKQPSGDKEDAKPEVDSQDSDCESLSSPGDTASDIGSGSDTAEITDSEVVE